MRHFTLRNLVVVFALAVPLVAFTSAGAAPIPINFQVLDDPGEGFNDPVLGASRQAAFRFAADLWGSFFQSTFPGQAVDVGIRFDPSVAALTNFVAFSDAPRGRTSVDDNFMSTLSHLENLAQRRFSIGGRLPLIVFNSSEDFFLGPSGNPGNKLDFVTFALHEFGHLFGFITALRTDGTYLGGFPSYYDFFVVDQFGNALVDLSPEERIAAATNFGNLFWGGENGIAGNSGIGPNLAASTTFDPLVSVVHLSETFGPDVLMDPNKDFGEVIHALSLMERGIFEDLGWTLAPLQTVPEPATCLLLAGGLAGLVYIQRRTAARNGHCADVKRPAGA